MLIELLKKYLNRQEGIKINKTINLSNPIIEHEHQSIQVKIIRKRIKEIQFVINNFLADQKAYKAQAMR